MALDKKFKRKWLKALRSGEYRQGKDTLRTGSAFCCLGVACDLIDPKGWVTPDAAGSGFYHWKTGKIRQMRSSFIPKTTARKIGLTEVQQGTLSKLNDEHRFSFKQIADHIEKEL